MDLIEASAPKNCNHHTILRASKLNKLVLKVMLVAISAALPISSFADYVTDPKSFVVEKSNSSFISEKAKARKLRFRAAAEELRRNPHAADLSECATKEAASTGLCIPKPVTAPNSGAEASGHNV